MTPLRKNMHNRLLPLFDKRLLRRRSLIETINDQLKNISQIEHGRHRSIAHFMVHLVVGIIAYTHQPLKPLVNLTNQQLMLLE